MPKKTFFNLTEDKQKNILDASIQVFSTGTFKEVKVSDIIKKASIPRSSFYDYFDDKMDLYRFIIDNIGEKKAKYYELDLKDNDFFILLRSYIYAGIKFISYEPELNAIAKNFLSDKALMASMYPDRAVGANDAFKSMLVQAVQAGQIRENIDLDFVSRTLNILATELMIEGAKDDNKSLELVLEEIADKMIEFIKYGIAI